MTSGKFERIFYTEVSFETTLRKLRGNLGHRQFIDVVVFDFLRPNMQKLDQFQYEQRDFNYLVNQQKSGVEHNKNKNDL